MKHFWQLKSYTHILFTTKAVVSNNQKQTSMFHCKVTETNIFTLALEQSNPVFGFSFAQLLPSHGAYRYLSKLICHVSVLIRYQTYFCFLQSSQYSSNQLQPHTSAVKPPDSLNISSWLQIWKYTFCLSLDWRMVHLYLNPTPLYYFFKRQR